MKNKIKKAFNDVVSLPRWKIYSDKELILNDNPLFPVSARISHNWDKMQISAHEKLDEIIDSCLQFYSIENVSEDPLKYIMYMMIAHEEGHWKICPFDAQYFEDILAGSYEGLKESGFSSEDNGDWIERSGFLAAMKHTMGTFEDIVVNSVLSIRDTDRENINRGHFLFDLTYLCSPAFKPTDFNTIYADTNARLCFYDSELYAPLSTGFSENWLELEEDVFRAIRAFCPNIGVAQKVAQGVANHEERISLARYMSSPKDKRWYNMAREYARVVGPYLRKEHDDIKDMVEQSPFMKLLFGEPDKSECMEYFDAEQEIDIDSQDSHQDNQEFKQDAQEEKEKQNEKDDKNSQKDESKDKNIDPEKLKKIKEIKEAKEEDGRSEEDEDSEENKKGVNKDFLDELLGIGLEKGREVNYADRFSYLDKLYERRAEKIVINILEENRDDLSTRVADMTRELMTPDNMDLKRVQWHRSRFIRSNAEKRLLLYRGDIPIESQDPSAPGKNSIPDIALIADSSRSMEADLEKGDERPYDLLLRGKWALFNWLRRTGKGYHMNFASINFSESTYSSGWHPYEELDQVKKHLLRFQNGGTFLNPEAIKELYENRKDPFLAILTTDGALERPQNTIDELKSMVDNGNYLAIISIQTEWREDRLVDDLRDYADIHIIRNPRDMIGIDIGYGRKFWGEANK